MNRLNQNVGISLLDWPGAVPSRLGEAVVSRAKSRKQTRIPQLRIVSDGGNNDLFKHATVAMSGTRFGESIVYAALAIGAIAALVVAFGI